MHEEQSVELVHSGCSFCQFQRNVLGSKHTNELVYVAGSGSIFARSSSCYFCFHQLSYILCNITCLICFWAICPHLPLDVVLWGPILSSRQFFYVTCCCVYPFFFKHDYCLTLTLCLCCCINTLLSSLTLKTLPNPASASNLYDSLSSTTAH